MSTVNEDEINEVNDNLVKEENENAVVYEITTEQKTEPLDAMAVEENDVVIEEQKETAEEIVNDDANEESAMVEENEQEQIPEENEDTPIEEHEDAPLEEHEDAPLEEHEDAPLEEQEEEMDNIIEETAQEDVQDMMNVDKPEENEDIVEIAEEVKEESVKSKNNSTSKINSRQSSRASLGKQSSKHSSKQNSSKNLNNNSNGVSMIDKAFTEPVSEQNEMRIYNGPIYCIEQVRIPPELPDIMKNYAKHIIRTQPDDVITESYEYFKKLNKIRNTSLEDDYDDKSKNMSYSKDANGSDILGNSNFSINSEKNENGTEKGTIKLSPLELESFYERLLDYSEGNDTIPIADIRTMAEDANISQSHVNEAIVVGSWDNDVEWLKFWALIVAGSFTNLMSTLKVVIDIIGDDNLIPLKKATTIIEFLLESDPNSKEEITNSVISQLKERNDEIIEKGELNEIISVLK